MLISEPRFAAAYRSDADAAVFDDIGCLLDALDRAALETQPNAVGDRDGSGARATVWFLDSDRNWMAADEVVFLRSAGLSTPMHGGIQAFASRAAAEEAAASAGGSVIDTLAELRESWRLGRPGGTS
jgi:hypothetical protein